jgi:hypothetical protein
MPLFLFSAWKEDRKMNEIPSLASFLTLVAGGGFAGAVVAFALEHIGSFQKLNAEVKKWLVLTLYVVPPLAATALMQFVPASVWTVLEPYWRALAIGFVGWVTSQVVHNWDRMKNARQ